MNFQKPGQDPNEQKRLLLAVAVCGAILFGWSWLSPPAPPVQPNTGGAPVSGAALPSGAAPGSAAAAPGSVPAVAPASVAAIERRILATLAAEGRQTVTLTNDDGQLAAWDLEEAQYRDPTENKDKTIPYRMMRGLDGGEFGKGFFLPPRLEIEVAGRALRGDYTLVEQGDRKAVLAFTDATSGARITRTWQLAADDYTAELLVTIENPGAVSLPYGLAAVVPGIQNDAEAGGSMFSPPVYAFSALCRHTEDLENQPVAKVLSNQTDPDEAKTWAAGVGWAGVTNRYFMSAVLPAAGEAESCTFAAGSAVATTVPPGFSLVSSSVRLKGGEVQAGGRAERRLTFYLGPKKLDHLKAQNPPMDETVDLGWFPIIGLPMLWLMQFFYGFLSNWGIAIILLTIVVKLLTLPLTHKQYKSMAAMKKLQPLLKLLQQKHANDKPRLQQEMMKLYKENKVNPLAGCLPMILMMPIYVSLYQTIYSAVELYRADFVFWIKDLSERDPYFIWPLLLGALFFLQMRLNPSVSDNPQQKIIMNVMPIMFTAMMLFLPSGLVIYIFVNTLLGLAQQLFLYKKEEELKAPPASVAKRRAT